MKALEHCEVVRPLRAELGFELFLGEDAFFDQEFRCRVGHRQVAHHELFERNGLFGVSSAIGSPVV